MGDDQISSSAAYRVFCTEPDNLIGWVGGIILWENLP